MVSFVKLTISFSTGWVCVWVGFFFFCENECLCCVFMKRMSSLSVFKEMKHWNDGTALSDTFKTKTTTNQCLDYLLIFLCCLQQLPHDCILSMQNSNTQHGLSVLPLPDLYLKRPSGCYSATSPRFGQREPKTLRISDTTHRHTLKIIARPFSRH